MKLFREVDDKCRELIADGLQQDGASLEIITCNRLELLSRVGSRARVVPLVDADEPQIVRCSVRDQVLENS